MPRRPARSLIDDQRRAFNETVRQLLAKADPQTLANNFSTELARAWPRKAIGFSIGATRLSLRAGAAAGKSNPAWEKFLLGNGSFLAGTTPATVYWVSGDELAKPDQLRKSKTGGGELTLNAFNNSNAAPRKSWQPASKGRPNRPERRSTKQGKRGLEADAVRSRKGAPAACQAARNASLMTSKALEKKPCQTVPSRSRRSRSAADGSKDASRAGNRQSRTSGAGQTGNRPAQRRPAAPHG